MLILSINFLCYHLCSKDYCRTVQRYTISNEIASKQHRGNQQGAIK